MVRLPLVVVRVGWGGMEEKEGREEEGGAVVEQRRRCSSEIEELDLQKRLARGREPGGERMLRFRGE